MSILVVIAAGINQNGAQVLPGFNVGASKVVAFWLAFLRNLAQLGLNRSR